MYSRSNPSAEFLGLSEQYRLLHSMQGEDEAPNRRFPGKSMYPHVQTIRSLVELTGAKTVLDYGSGKGRQYSDVWVKRHRGAFMGTIPRYWEVEVTPWDPNYEPLSRTPTTQFDGVVSTDVLEHIPAQDLPWMIREIFGFARRFVFINIGNYPAKQVLPDGRNAHVSVLPSAVWRELIETQAANFPEIKYVIRLTHRRKKHWDVFANFDWVPPVENVGIVPAGWLKVAGYYFFRLTQR